MKQSLLSIIHVRHTTSVQSHYICNTCEYITQLGETYWYVSLFDNGHYKTT
jgi:hypothetical protein